MTVLQKKKNEVVRGDATSASKRELPQWKGEQHCLFYFHFDPPHLPVTLHHNMRRRAGGNVLHETTRADDEAEVRSDHESDHEDNVKEERQSQPNWVDPSSYFNSAVILKNRDWIFEMLLDLLSKV